MTRRTTRRIGAIAAALAVTAATGGGAVEGSTAETLTLWVYDDGRIPILTELGAEFEEEFGVGVTVEAVDLTELRNQMSARRRGQRAGPRHHPARQPRRPGRERRGRSR